MTATIQTAMIPARGDVLLAAEPAPPRPGDRRTPTAAAIASLVRARARLRAAWIERLWSAGQTSVDQGLAITPAEVRRILIDPELETELYLRFLAEDAVEKAKSGQVSGFAVFCF